jgi:hypothetical protein
MPNPNTYNNNGRELVRVQDDMKKAEVEKNKKRQTATDFASRQFPSPQINIACCQNSMTCASGADCDNITQNCEAKITSLKDEKKKEAEEVSAAAAADATLKKTGQEATTNNVGQKSSNNVSYPTSTSSNDNPNIIYISSCCLLCSIVIIIIIIIFNKKL